MPERLRIALIAHDTKKDALVTWAKRWEHWLAGHPPRYRVERRGRGARLPLASGGAAQKRA